MHHCPGFGAGSATAVRGGRSAVAAAAATRLQTAWRGHFSRRVFGQLWGRRPTAVGRVEWWRTVDTAVSPEALLVSAPARF